MFGNKNSLGISGQTSLILTDIKRLYKTIKQVVNRFNSTPNDTCFQLDIDQDLILSTGI